MLGQKLRHPLGVSEVNKKDFDAHTRQPGGKEAVGAAIHHVVRYDFIACVDGNANRRAKGRHTRDKTNRHVPAFGLRQMLFQHASRGFIEPVVNVNRPVLLISLLICGTCFKALGAAVYCLQTNTQTMPTSEELDGGQNSSVY